MAVSADNRCGNATTHGARCGLTATARKSARSWGMAGASKYGGEKEEDGGVS